MRCNVAKALQSQGKNQEAIEQLKKAIEIFPNDPKIYCALADLLVSQNLLDDAVVYLEKAVQLVPNNGDLYCQIAGIMSKKGDISNVIINLHRALDINPGYVRALSGLVDISVNNSNPDVRGQVKAVEYARRAVQYTNRQNPAILNLLAMALASDKQFAEAAVTAEEALNLALAAGANDLAGYIRTQLESYKKQLN